MAKPTTLVLLPGLDGTEIFYRPLVASLPDSVHPVVVTFPLAGTNSYTELLGFVRQALVDVPECVVVGWSFAGPLALMLAEAEPDKVRGVILAATFVRPPRRLLSGLRLALVPSAVWSWRALRRLPLWLLRPSTDPLRRAKTETWMRIPASVIGTRLRAISAIDVSATLRRCAQPIMYLASRSDIVVPRRNADEITRLRPDVKVVTIDGRHLALYTNPQAAAAAIVDFIATIESAARPPQTV